MTDTSAPERIFAHAAMDGWWGYWNKFADEEYDEKDEHPETTYTRTDISEARIAELTAERAALESSLQHAKSDLIHSQNHAKHLQRQLDQERAIVAETKLRWAKERKAAMGRPNPMIWTILSYYALFAVPVCTLILWCGFIEYRRETRREQQDD